MIDATSASQLPKQNNTIHLKDYQAPPFSIMSVDLLFELIPNRTVVTSVLEIQAATDKR